MDVAGKAFKLGKKKGKGKCEKYAKTVDRHAADGLFLCGALWLLSVILRPVRNEKMPENHPVSTKCARNSQRLVDF